MPICFRVTYHGVRHNKISGAIISFAVLEKDLAEAMKVSSLEEKMLYISVLKEDEVGEST